MVLDMHAADHRNTDFFEPSHEVGHNGSLGGCVTRSDALAHRKPRPSSIICHPRGPPQGGDPLEERGTLVQIMPDHLLGHTPEEVQLWLRFSWAT
jgi:hypothetical protein